MTTLFFKKGAFRTNRAAIERPADPAPTIATVVLSLNIEIPPFVFAYIFKSKAYLYYISIINNIPIGESPYIKKTAL
ncbi:hypothetical protein GCM10008982_23430 [Anoxybacillus voinovskiensis]|nr:hypothetical protein GCM10008982_23430 [Anoxybacillus voinovskiensis]